MSQFIQEAKRRSVIRVAGLYLTAVWLLLQIAGTVLPMLDAPDWLARTLLIVLIIGFVPVLVVAWVFEWTPGGLVRDGAAKLDLDASVRAGKRLDRWIMLLLALALSYFAVDKFLLSPQRQQAQLQVAKKEGRTEAIVGAYGEKSIAVLPFRDMSQKQDQQYLSDGLAEQVLQLLSEIRNLRVISRSSAFAFRDQDVPISTMARSSKSATCWRDRSARPATASASPYGWWRPIRTPISGRIHTTARWATSSRSRTRSPRAWWSNSR